MPQKPISHESDTTQRSNLSSQQPSLAASPDKPGTAPTTQSKNTVAAPQDVTKQASASRKPVPITSQDTYQVNEQFTGPALDSSLWEVITYPKGYRNNEEQDYRPSQVSVANSNLQITASRDSGGAWHSGEVHSKWNYTYGEFEVRMAISAAGPGVWPAAWLMGRTDEWPNNGEIDIMEHINSEPTVYGTIHGGGARGMWQLQSWLAPIDVTAYHTYKIDKKPGVISWWVDGVKRGEWSQSQTPAGGVWPFENHRNFGLLNLAIGGDWPGPSNSVTPSTITMNVDFFTVKNGQ